jgi:hypothetical protein
VSRLLDYYEYLVDVQKHQPVTISGYSTAIARVYKILTSPSPTDSYLVTGFLARVEIDNPKCRTLVPKWSLDLVLDMLQSQTYNPINSLSGKT